ncbi:MAG: hypothetical protein ACX93O_06315 [Flagellimonas sp.]
MIIKRSELRIEKFNLLGINVISFANDDSGTAKELTNNNFDLDFDIFLNKEDIDMFKIMIRLDNFDIKNTKQTGYGIDVSGEFKFRFNNAKGLDDDMQSVLISRSALPMAIGHIRSVIAITTGNFHLGPYYLPSIDLNDLFEKKANSLQVNVENEDI